MKYRMLTVEELKELEKEFIQFLSSNTITGPDWENIKKNKPQKAEEMLGMFSDIVMEKALKNIKWAEVITPQSIRTFWFQEKKVSLVGIDINDSSIDLTKDPLSKLGKINHGSEPLKIWRTDKEYNVQREEELWEVLSKGASIVSAERYKWLNDLYESTKSSKN